MWWITLNFFQAAFVMTFLIYLHAIVITVTWDSEELITSAEFIFFIINLFLIFFPHFQGALAH